MKACIFYWNLLRLLICDLIATMPASKRCGVADTGAFFLRNLKENWPLPLEVCIYRSAILQFLTMAVASGDDFKEYAGVDLCALPTTRSKGRDLGAFPPVEREQRYIRHAVHFPSSSSTNFLHKS